MADDKHSRYRVYTIARGTGRERTEAICGTLGMAVGLASEMLEEMANEDLGPSDTVGIAPADDVVLAGYVRGIP